MIRIAAASIAYVAMMVAGCSSVNRAPELQPTRARFFLEATGGQGQLLVLPQSGVSLAVNAQPVLTEGDIVNVEIAQVELGKCLMFQLTPAAARDAYRLTGSHQGRRLVLVIDGMPLGARRIDAPIGDGVLFIFAEVPDSALPTLVAELKSSAVQLQRELARK